MGKSIHSSVGGELNLQKLGSVLVVLSGGCVEFSLKASIAKRTVVEVKSVFWGVDWN